MKEKKNVSLKLFEKYGKGYRKSDTLEWTNLPENLDAYLHRQLSKFSLDLKNAKEDANKKFNEYLKERELFTYAYPRLKESSSDMIDFMLRQEIFYKKKREWCNAANRVKFCKKQIKSFQKIHLEYLNTKNFYGVEKALSEWVEAHPEDEKRQPYVSIGDKELTLTQMQNEIKNNTQTGKNFINGVLKLTLDLISRNKEHL